MGSFPFDKLPVELQLMVWQHARASIGQVITGDLDLSATTPYIRGQNINRVLNCIRLFSICHNSRQEVLRNPPVLIVEHPDCRRLDYRDPTYAAKPLTIKHWDFGRVFTDIAFDLCLLGWAPDPERVTERYRQRQSSTEFVRKALLVLFGATIRRLHVYGGDHWETPEKALHSSQVTFPDSDALHFMIPGMGTKGLGEVARRDANGVTALNSIADPLALSDDFRGRGDCLWFCDRRETLVSLVSGMRPYFPDLEYVSLLSWRAF
jgi:hypothetical protein